MANKYIIVFISIFTISVFIKLYQNVNTEIQPCNPYVYSRSVYVGNNRGNGTGVILNSKYILTAKHVTNGQGMVIVHRQEGEVGVFPVIYESSEHDFSLIANKSNNKDSVIKFNYNIISQERACSVGNPTTGSFISANPIMLFISWGLGPSGEIDKYTMFLPGGVEAGFSGSGIFNNKDELLSIVTWCGMGNSLCGGIPIQTVKLELAET